MPHKRKSYFCIVFRSPSEEQNTREKSVIFELRTRHVRGAGAADDRPARARAWPRRLGRVGAARLGRGDRGSQLYSAYLRDRPFAEAARLKRAAWQPAAQ